MVFALFYLAKHGDVQERVLKEVNCINTTELSVNVLNDMKYLEQVLKETMRLAPAIPLVSRQLKEDVILGN